MSFSAMLAVVYLVATRWTLLVLNQFHLDPLIQIPRDCIPVGIIARVAFRQSIAGVVVDSIKTGCLLLLSITKSVAVRVECLG